GRKRRSYQKLDMLRTTGRKKQKLRPRHDIFAAPQKHAPTLAAKRRSARFAGRDDVRAFRPKQVNKHSQLRCFAAAVYAFESDEFAAHLSISLLFFLEKSLKWNV